MLIRVGHGKCKKPAALCSRFEHPRANGVLPRGQALCAVDDHIKRLGHKSRVLPPRLLPVVDDLVDPQRSSQGVVGGGARDERRAAFLGQLHGHRAHRAASSQYQHSVPTLDVRRLHAEQGMACAVGKRRRLHVGHVARLEHRHGGVHQRVLRQAPERGKVPGGYHHVPNLELVRCRPVHLLHRAANVVAGDVWEGRLAHKIHTAAQGSPIPWAEGARVHFHQSLGTSRLEPRTRVLVAYGKGLLGLTKGLCQDALHVRLR
mmetsp:Transcript_42125/g.80595  ORF Transcript_42125/g.80595 Transcript_42125/m.80595 type:complete len:261 (+) Transcript_42125:531-1313(+)